MSKDYNAEPVSHRKNTTGVWRMQKKSENCKEWSDCEFHDRFDTFEEAEEALKKSIAVAPHLNISSRIVRNDGLLYQIRARSSSFGRCTNRAD